MLILLCCIFVFGYDNQLFHSKFSLSLGKILLGVPWIVIFANLLSESHRGNDSLRSFNQIMLGMVGGAAGPRLAQHPRLEKKQWVLIVFFWLALSRE